MSCPYRSPSAWRIRSCQPKRRKDDPSFRTLRRESKGFVILGKPLRPLGKDYSLHERVHSFRANSPDGPSQALARSRRKIFQLHREICSARRRHIGLGKHPGIPFTRSVFGIRLPRYRKALQLRAHSHHHHRSHARGLVGLY
jgi:hypothetical protein